MPIKESIYVREAHTILNESQLARHSFAESEDPDKRRLGRQLPETFKAISILHKHLTRIFVVMISLISSPMHGQDFILEFKGEYFLPSNITFKQIYSNGGGAYGAQATMQLNDKFYGFVSADFFNKNGQSIGFCSPTKINMVNIGIGLEYFVPFSYGDLYAGLGILPTKLNIIDCSPFVVQNQTKWGYGGIAKLGAYLDLSKSFVLDLFFDYSFVNIKFNCCPTPITQANIVQLNGCWFGAGIGYRFN